MKFIQQTRLDRLKTGAVSLLGKVGEVQPPHLVLPLTVEPTKARLCHDARFLNLWMQDKAFKLDRVSDLPCYVSRDSYQSVLDDKSGYDHMNIFWHPVGWVVFHLQYATVWLEDFTVRLS